MAHSALQKLDQDERCNWFHAHITNGVTIFMPVFVVSQDESRDGKQRENLTFGEACLEKLKGACVQKIVAQAKAGQLQKAKRAAYVLLYFSDGENGWLTKNPLKNSLRLR